MRHRFFMEVMPRECVRISFVALAVVVNSAVAGEIHGLVWKDLNGFGIVQPTSPFVAGITVYLDLNENGVLDPSETRAVSNTYGRFVFGGLAPGTYKVSMKNR